MKSSHSYIMRGLSMLLFAAVLVVGLTACGGGDAPDSSDDSGDDMAAEDDAPAMTQDSLTIVDIAVSDARFTTLVTALDSTDLVSSLSEDGPFTVFAPTNEAFEALPDGALDDLIGADDKSDLEGILLYHVVEGETLSDDLEDGEQTVTTMQGDDLTIEVSDEGVMVGEGQVVEADIEAANGVIHVVDSVLMPPEED
ncbi:MAG: fasciclin domain-containing protein [Longimonas sp.]|uniref:fasciclin domain-containing protein n=1 Tax=Longimonas sp. TaxID=2039626 RepID=UPI00397564A9